MLKTTNNKKVKLILHRYLSQAVWLGKQKARMKPKRNMGYVFILDLYRLSKCKLLLCSYERCHLRLALPIS